MRRLLVIACLVVAAPVRAETVALLPLDGEKRLEIYGQPVASEIGRALEASGVSVVVVGANMDVPDRAQLIVDGTIKAGKGSTVTLSIRIRDPRAGTVLESLPAATTTLDNIDKAAAELSAKVVPSVKTRLAAMTKPAVTPSVEPAPRPVTPSEPTRPVERGPTTLPVTLLTVSMPAGATGPVEVLRHAFDGELDRWAREHGRARKAAEPNALALPDAYSHVRAAGADAGVALHVLAYTVTLGKVPTARARVRLRVVDRDRVAFDRVIVTDTIVGDRDIAPAALAGRVARAVLAIAHPNVRRSISTWR